jgi:hypothetical protein
MNTSRTQRSEKSGDLAEGESDSFIRNLFLALGKSSREVYNVTGVGLINVHVKSESPGWWNIIKTVKRDFTTLSTSRDNFPGIPYYYIFLIGRKDQHIADGYIATDFNQSPFIHPPHEEATKYSVYASQHLNQNRIILTINRVAQTLIQQGNIR